MGLKERLGIPKMDDVIQMLDERFELLIGKLDDILQELRSQRLDDEP